MQYAAKGGREREYTRLGMHRRVFGTFLDGNGGVVLMVEGLVEGERRGGEGAGGEIRQFEE